MIDEEKFFEQPLKNSLRTYDDIKDFNWSRR